MPIRFELLRASTSMLCLILCSGAALAKESSCAPTLLSREEAQRLVLLVPAALDIAKRGGHPFTVKEWTPPDEVDSFSFMLEFTVSPPLETDHPLIGYFSVSKKTGRVLNVAETEEIGKELGKLQSQLRTKHCVSAEMVKKEKDLDP